MTNRWRIHLNRTELPSEPSLMPEHFSIGNNSVRTISGWEPVREIRLDKPVKELSPDAISFKRPSEWDTPHNPIKIVKTEPLAAV